MEVGNVQFLRTLTEFQRVPWHCGDLDHEEVTDSILPSLPPSLPCPRGKLMGLARDTLKRSPEVGVETGGTVGLVREAEPHAQALPADLAIRGLFRSGCGPPETFLGAAGL